MQLPIKKFQGHLTAIAVGMIMFILVLAGCKKDGQPIIIKQAVFPASALTASTDSVGLSVANSGDTVIRFKWPAVNNASQVLIGYTLQLDRVSDTSGAAGWAKAKSFLAGVNGLSWAFLGNDLSNFASAMGFGPGSVNPVAVRVISNVQQAGGSNSTVAPVYSNSLVFLVTVPKFPPYLFIPGGYQGWNPGAAPTLNLKGSTGLYEGYVNITGGGIQYFKYTNSPDWDHTNYGDGGNGTFSTDGNAAGLSVPNDGYYELTANLNTNTWTATAVTWGIIGDATPGGWGSDTQMTYDANNQVWTVTAAMKQNGSYKFRANGGWTIDFGIDNSGNLAYADNPFFGYTNGLNNLTVPADGNYTITLDLHISGQYSYKAVKN
ncbi:SusE domain-containing protein [Flavitalea flava]